VQKLKAPVRVPLRDGNYQPEVGFDQLLFGGFGFLLATLDDQQRPAELGRARAAIFLELLDSLAALGQLFLQVASAGGMPVRWFFELALNARDLAFQR